MSNRPMSPLMKLVKIVSAPSEAAVAIREKPDVLLPIVMMILIPLIPILSDYQGYLDTLVSALAINPQTSAMAADQLREIAQVSAITGIAFAPVMMVVAWLVGSLILFGAVRISGGECRYKQILSLKGYTSVFGLLAALVTMGVSMATGSSFTQQSYTSLLSLFPEIPSGFLAGIATGVELFSIWSVVVTGIGITVIAALTKKKAYIIVGILFALGLLLTGLSGQIGAAFGGIG